MGRKRKLSTVKHESTEEKLQREMIKEKLFEYTGIQMTPPRHLSNEARAEYRRIQPLLEELPISSLDKTMVEVYCNLYSIYLKLEVDVNERGEMVTSYYADGGVKDVRPNPAIHEMLKVAKEIRAICAELGMTINSRMRLVEPSLEEEDAMADLMNGVD